MATPHDIIQAAQKEGRTALYEHEAKALVREYGIIVPRHAVVGPDDTPALLAEAEKIGYPVALKAVSPDILHKTDAGAVMLNIQAGPALSSSVLVMKNMVAAKAPGAGIRHFLVEKMMPQGLELLIGGMRDAQFGPSIAFGLGGIWVEALQDAAFGILPMTREEILSMIDGTRAGQFLKGFRGSPALDLEAVLATIHAVGKILDDHPAIGEIDLNPVRVYARSAAALDVRIVLN